MKRQILPILLAATILLGTAAYNSPRTINAGQINLNSPGNEPRSLSDIVNFTQKSNLAEGQLYPTPPCQGPCPSLSPWEQALRTINDYPGTSQVYREACNKYTCPGGVPTPSDVEIATINIPPQSPCNPTCPLDPTGVAVNNATNKVYAANYNGNTLDVFDGTGNSLPVQVAVGTNPLGVAVNSITNKVYVANYASKNISIYDANIQKVTTTVLVGPGPTGVAVNPVTNTIYVTNNIAGTVSIVDGTLLSVTQVTVGQGPTGVAVNPATNKIYVANFGAGTVSIIDGGTLAVTSLTIGGSPSFVAVNPLTSKVYVTQAAGTLAIIDGNSLSFTTISVGTGPTGVAVNTATNRIYVANNGAPPYGAYTVAVIDGNTNTLIRSVTVGTNPYGVAVNPNTGLAYATNSREGTVSIIGQREEVREACLRAVNPACLVVSSTGTLFPGTPNSVAVSLVAISIRTNTTNTGAQMALTILCDNNTSNPNQQCSAFYIDGNIWDATVTSPGTFLVVNAEPYFYLKWHWWDFTNTKIVIWSTSWYGTATNPNWYWGVYWWWRTYVNYYVKLWLPWWWWSWHWMYWRYWDWGNTNFQT